MSSAIALKLPSLETMSANFEALRKRSEPVQRYYEAFVSGAFTHPDGRTDDLGVVRLSPEIAALLSHLCTVNPTSLSVEVGFGMGSSCTVLLSTLKDIGRDFEHIVIDPYGIGNGRGDVVKDYLETHFEFRRIRELSIIGLGQLVMEKGRGAAGLIFIDGDHKFDSVFTDFVLADLLCAVGGHIVFDDAYFPAIETVVNYIIANRPDYEVQHLVVRNASIVKKIASDERRWDSFIPFTVPNRRDWTGSFTKATS